MLCAGKVNGFGVNCLFVKPCSGENVSSGYLKFAEFMLDLCVYIVNFAMHRKRDLQCEVFSLCGFVFLTV